jgi:hypothetical protein
MRVEAIEQLAGGGERTVRSEVRFAGGGSLPLWFRASDAGPWPAPGDPLLATMLAPALGLQEDLHIDGPVSAALLAAARERVLPVLQRFHPGFEAVEIHAAEEVEEGHWPEPPRGAVAFFSGGLDSHYTLERNRDALTHLAFVHGFDMGLREKRVRAEVLEQVRAVARAHGLGLVEVWSKVRTEVLRPVARRLRKSGRLKHQDFLLDWQFGCQLVAYAQLLSRTAGRALIPASWDVSYEASTGSHSDLEPGWSTRHLRIELDGAAATRPEKARHLARCAPDRLRTLRVCQARPRVARNCGRCPKCIRLRMELRVAGVPPELHPFDAPLSEAELRRSFVKVDDCCWPTILRFARERGDPREIRTIEILMDRRFHLVRELERLRRRVTTPRHKHVRRKTTVSGT